MATIKIWKTKKPSKFILHLALTALASIVAVLLSFGLAYIFVVPGVKYDLPLESDSGSKQIVLMTDFLAADPKAGTMVADWYTFPATCDTLEETEDVVNIYFDSNLLMPNDGDNDSPPSNEPPSEPTFQLSMKAACDENPSHYSYPTFRTTSKLISVVDSNRSNRFKGGALQSYPFDSYFANFYLFARINSTGEPVGIFTDPPSGAPVNFNVKLNSNFSFSGAEEGVSISLSVTRSMSVKVLAIIIVIANWIVTGAFIYITAACMIWREEAIVAELFALPIGAVFAFTSVRANLPGAPDGFGAVIDFIGILPNLAIMTLASSVLLILVLFRRVAARKRNQSKDIEVNDTKE